VAGYLRSASTARGAAAGLVAAVVLLLPRLQPGGADAGLLQLDSDAATVVLQLVVGVLLGVVLVYAAPDRGASLAPTITIGLTVGLLWWVLGALTISPLLRGESPSWSVEAAGAAFPAVVGNLFWGGVAALSLCALAAVSRPEERTAAAVTPKRRVVILGGGFGGVAAAQRLERLFTHDREFELTLVSESNYLLFTPMLAEVASSALAAQHISAPLRAACPRARFRRAVITKVDVETNTVRLRAGGRAEELPYDHLVLALGSEPEFRGLPGVAEHAFALKTLGDAGLLRNHVIEQLERADSEPDPAARRRLVTFVVVGGGFAGTELVAELFDLVHEVLRYYPHVPRDELRFVLVHSRDRILPELGPELADYALQKLRARGIEFVLETRVAGATADEILLGGGDPIATRTVVWTAGNRPNRLLATLPWQPARSGAVVVDETLRVAGSTNVWAVGDCAQIPDPDAGGFFPPTAQHALREGKVVAENVAAAFVGREPRPFRFQTVGMLVALGHRTAVAEIRGRRFSGLLAWLLWRAVYWSKLPGLEKKTRVLLDWTVDLVFARDIVLTGAPERTAPSGEARAGDR
jgi:NADH dehydrogenase FAD-containing subunit